MKIRIDYKNTIALQVALENANGRSKIHTFATAGDIVECARQAEQELKRLGLTKNRRDGAIAKSSSGDSLPNAYRHQRVTTMVIMVRGSDAWFVTEISSLKSWDKSSGSTYVCLTEAQDKFVTDLFRSGYGKQPAATLVATTTEVAS
tara:strand:- start:47 stop:487 length:441 start_codon:yes stop_codon:yes gene_type:complete